jgi:uncharacterized membrane protein YgaE (UPF0421/DUF939 family)
MIKIFRIIRPRMLAENEFTTYLIYAFGEIALVMIGILLALQVNHWNIEQQDKSMELDILKIMQNNLTSDPNDIEFKTSFYKVEQNANTAVLNAHKNPLQHPTLNFSYANLGPPPFFLKTLRHLTN